MTPIWLMSVDITGADRSRWKWMNWELSANTVVFISCRGRLLTSIADESHSVGWKLLIHWLSLWSVCSSNVYWREAGRCSSFSFILKYFLSFYLSRFSFYINILLPSFVLQWHHEEDNFFLEYVQSNQLFYAGYCLEMPSSFLYIQELH